MQKKKMEDKFGFEATDRINRVLKKLSKKDLEKVAGDIENQYKKKKKKKG